MVLDFKMVQATRIEDEFGRMGDIASALRNVINEAHRKNAQAKDKAPDDALIPVSIQLTLKQTRTILNKFRPSIAAPSDRDIYVLVKNAMDAAE
jgi:hypothetical protein